MDVTDHRNAAGSRLLDQPPLSVRPVAATGGLAAVSALSVEGLFRILAHGSSLAPTPRSAALKASEQSAARLALLETILDRRDQEISVHGLDQMPVGERRQ